MNFKTILTAIFAGALSCSQAFGQATILPPGETCFQAVTGLNGMIGALGTITGGSSYTNGTYGGVSLTGGSGSNATANITVSGGLVTAVAVLNPGVNYVVGDVLSASAASIGGTGSGFSVPVNSTSINSAVAGGTVGFYIPSTLTIKQTWQDAGELTLNINPVPLDSNGCAVIYGAGIYRQILKDSLGNTIWDKLTASTGPAGLFWAGTAAGTPNIITIADSNFALQDGATIQFRALAENTGPTTIIVSGGSPISIVKDTSTGPAALSGGEIGPNNTPLLTYDAINAEFHIVNPASNSSSATSSSLTPPQGYLNLVGQASGDVVQTGDVIAATTVFYSPYVGASIPVWNGSVFVQTAFSELTATLTSAGSPASSIQDTCVFSNNGVPTLAVGPAWTTPTAGSGNRGTGAGTAQITRLQGIWVNAVSIIGYNGLSSYTIPANQCTYVGSLSIDSTAGQVTAHRTWGQNRKFGVWNAYNRQTITLLVGDATATWSSAIGTLHPSNGTGANNCAVFQGLPEELVNVQFIQQTQPNGSSTGSAIGWNSLSTSSGVQGVLNSTGATGVVANAIANYQAPPFLGNSVATALESGNAFSPTFVGTQSHMQLSAQWRG